MKIQWKTMLEEFFVPLNGELHSIANLDKN